MRLVDEINGSRGDGPGERLNVDDTSSRVVVGLNLRRPAAERGRSWGRCFQ